MQKPKQKERLTILHSREYKFVCIITKMIFQSLKSRLDCIVNSKHTYHNRDQ